MLINNIDNDLTFDINTVPFNDLSIINTNHHTINNTSHSTLLFLDKDGNEVLKFTPDGDIFWKGKLIEMDSDFKEAVFDIRRLLLLNGLRIL